MNKVQNNKINQRLIPKLVSLNNLQKWMDTHSILKIQIPKQYEQSYCSFQWIAQQFVKQKQTLSDQCAQMLSRIKGRKLGRQQQYRCTPLDYKSTILGKIFIQNNKKQELVKQYRFGPIKIEKQLINKITNYGAYEIKVVVQKSTLINGKIKLQYNFEQGHIKEIMMNFILPQFTFQLKMDKKTTLPSNSSFFKFYQRQDNCLGVSMYNQYSEFMQKLKKMKIYSHYGFYIKIYFQDRMKRDFFLFQIIKLAGIQIPQLSSISTHSYLVSKIRPSVSGISQIFGDDKKNTLTQRNKQKQVDQQIYKVLYQTSQFGGQQCSFEAAETSFLFTQSMKRSNMEAKKSQYQNIIKQSLFFNKIDIKTSNISHEKNSISPKKSMQIQNVSNYPGKQQKANSKNKSNLKLQKSMKANFDWINKEQQNKISGHQSRLRNTIVKLTNQIDDLLKQNKRLANQNKKLKDQNMRLRFKQIKNSTKFLIVNKSNNLKVIQNDNPNSPSQDQNSPKSHFSSSSPKEIYLSRKSKQKNRPKKVNLQKNLNIMNQSIPSLTDKKFTAMNISQIQNSRLQEFGNQESFRKQIKFQESKMLKSKKRFFPQKSKKQFNKQLFCGKSHDQSQQIIEKTSNRNSSPPPQTPFFQTNLQNTANFGSATAHASNFFSKYITS